MAGPGGWEGRWHNGCNGGSPRELVQIGTITVFGLASSVADRATVFVTGRALALPMYMDIFIIRFG